MTKTGAARKRDRMTRSFGLLFVLVALTAGLSACGRKAPLDTPPPPEEMSGETAGAQPEIAIGVPGAAA